MITSLSLQNFKCFEKQTLSFKPLTLLSGLNGTGKSSVIQALLLLRQSYQQLLLQSRGLALNGDLVHIGTAKDALFEWAADDIIGFDITCTDEYSKEEATGTWRFNYFKDKDVLDNIPPLSHFDQIYDSCLFSDRDFYYLQAERVGPRRFFETSDFLVRQKRQIGISGEYTAHFLSLFEKEPVVNHHVTHPDAVSLTIKDQVEAWLGEVSPGTRINLTQNVVTDTMSLQYTFAGKEISSKYRATNVGFGITYVLPILVAILASHPGSLLLIENPEAHLHPKGQAQMGDLLARAASGGVQIVVETHSDHVLNGIRVAVHDGKLQPDDVQLHFFQRRKDDGQSQVVSPRIKHDGRIDRWPDGFFDEWDKSLEALLD
jgi:predicted ATPase